MKHTIKNKINQIEVVFPEYTKKTVSGIIAEISEQITTHPRFTLGGFSNISNFDKKIKSSVFSNGKKTNIHNFELRQKESITQTIKNIFNQCNSTFPLKSKMVIFILPTNDQFTKDYLDGINGFALGKTTVILFMSPLDNGWKKILRYTFVHEYAHLISAHHVTCNSIRAGIVYEGLAENLREFILGGPRTKYSTALTRKKALNEISNIDNFLVDTVITDKNYSMYLDYLFGNKVIPKWYGYSLGYWLIYEVIKNYQIDIRKLFTMQPKKIFEIIKKTLGD